MVTQSSYCKHPRKQTNFSLEDVKTIESEESITLEKVTVEAVPAYNLKRFRSPNVPFHPKGLGVGFLITIQDKIIYHAGDTGFIPEMSSLKEVDLALLPCGGTYTMDINEAVDAVLAINPKRNKPISCYLN